MTETPLYALLRSGVIEHRVDLSKPKVLASSGHGRVKAGTEIFVTFILREIKLCKNKSVNHTP